MLSVGVAKLLVADKAAFRRAEVSFMVSAWY
jgi:hypothetical protein